ncbi:MAG TPA: hypothetical protein VJ846_11745, partial [Sphingomicrobium sp.]|nr:hypothetical protein [Sphingomicrobium sp.]
MKQFIWNDLEEQVRRAALQRPEQRASLELHAEVEAIVDDIRSGGWDRLCAIARRIDGEEPKLTKVGPLAAEARRTL